MDAPAGLSYKERMTFFRDQRLRQEALNELATRERTQDMTTRAQKVLDGTGTVEDLRAALGLFESDTPIAAWKQEG